MGDKSRGLYDKFIVERTDGSSAPGGKHEHCQYFVLDLDHDPFALVALAASSRISGFYEPKNQNCRRAQTMLGVFVQVRYAYGIYNSRPYVTFWVYALVAR